MSCLPITCFSPNVPAPNPPPIGHPGNHLSQEDSASITNITNQSSSLREKELLVLKKYQEFRSFYINSSTVHIIMMAGGVFIGYYLNLNHRIVITVLLSMTLLSGLFFAVDATRDLVNFMEPNCLEIDWERTDLHAKIEAERLRIFVQDNGATENTGGGLETRAAGYQRLNRVGTPVLKFKWNFVVGITVFLAAMGCWIIFSIGGQNKSNKTAGA